MVAPHKKAAVAQVRASQKRSKFGNKRKKNKDGSINYRSLYESRIHESNPSLMYEPMILKYEKTYKPDFLLIGKSGKKIFIEAKGYLRPEDRSKLLAVKRSNPHLHLRLLFTCATNVISGAGNRANRLAYWEWAELHGFMWAEGEHIPLAWYNE